MKIISVWSGPRNVSTALMYSFAQRKDTNVIDEPFYGHFLVNTKDADHPGRGEVIKTMETDHKKVIENILRHHSSEVLFIKNMAHHLIFDEPSFMKKMVNVFLIRDPREMLPSLLKNIPDAQMRDTGLQTQLKLYHNIISTLGDTIVLDSRQILLDPASILNQFCDFLKIEFDEAMLKWTPGARKEDGIWSKYWYQNVHKSSGFAKYLPKNENVPAEKQELLTDCIKIYDQLFEKAIKV